VECLPKRQFRNLMKARPYVVLFIEMCSRNITRCRVQAIKHGGCGNFLRRTNEIATFSKDPTNTQVKNRKTGIAFVSNLPFIAPLMIALAISPTTVMKIIRIVKSNKREIIVEL
jgi:hypothetical protein